MTEIVPVAIVMPLLKVDDDGIEILMQLRETPGKLEGSWEFPGGKIEGEESPFAAAQREFAEEVGVDIKDGNMDIFNIYPFDYGDVKVTLFTYLLYLNGDNLSLSIEKKLKKVRINFGQEMIHFDMKLPEANLKIISDLLSYIEKQKAEKTWEKLWEM